MQWDSPSIVLGNHSPTPKTKKAIDKFGGGGGNRTHVRTEAICVFKFYRAKVFVISYLKPKGAVDRGKKNYEDRSRNWPIKHSLQLITKKFPQDKVAQAHNPNS